MKIQINRLIDASFIALILFVIFVIAVLLSFLFRNLPVVLSASIIIIAVALTILFLDELEVFMLFVSAIVVVSVFVLTFNIEFTLATSAVFIGFLVILVVMVS